MRPSIHNPEICLNMSVPQWQPAAYNPLPMLRTILSLVTSVWLIAAIALTARVAFVWHQQRLIPHQVLATVPFDHEAGNIALALSERRGFSDVFRKPTGPTAWLAPVYPYLLAGIFRLFGALTFPAFLAAVSLNCLFSVATCFPLFFVARRIGGIAVAALTTWLWALYPQGIMMPFEWVWDTSLSVLLATTILWATLALRESTKTRNCVAYGILWGVALLTNPALGVLLPFLLLWLAQSHSSAAKPSWKKPSLAAAIAVLCCLPWTIRNYAAFHRFIQQRQ